MEWFHPRRCWRKLSTG
jgi:hypothetical protein